MIRFCLFFHFLCFFMNANIAYAQSSNIEINLDALESYAPPPMFEPEQPNAQDGLLPLPEPSSLNKKRVNVPLPEKKPVFIKRRSYDASKEIDIDASQVVLQTAQDILKQIDGVDGTLSHETAKGEAAPPVVKVESPPAPSIKERAVLSEQGDFNLVLPFKPQQNELSDEHKKILLQQVLLRLQKYENARLEIKSYASSLEAQATYARRLSLIRALAVQKFLIDKNIPETSIFVRPLGADNNGSADYIELIISRI